MSALIMPYDPSMNEELREIFFESSTKKSFKDAADKEAFYEKYLGYYLHHFPELALVAVGDRVLGYVVVAPESEGEELNAFQPHLKTFAAFLGDYPAHLHINCHFSSRGLGVGSRLLQEVEKKLRAINIKGLHIMTRSDAPNQSFYKKLGFNFQTELNFQGSAILFMGKSLADDKI
jgi:ribosomal protein S18 acetylase RimI-like enzyme